MIWKFLFFACRTFLLLSFLTAGFSSLTLVTLIRHFREAPVCIHDVFTADKQWRNFLVPVTALHDFFWSELTEPSKQNRAGLWCSEHWDASLMILLTKQTDVKAGFVWLQGAYLLKTRNDDESAIHPFNHLIPQSLCWGSWSLREPPWGSAPPPASATWNSCRELQLRGSFPRNLAMHARAGQQVNPCWLSRQQRHDSRPTRLISAHKPESTCDTSVYKSACTRSYLCTPSLFLCTPRCGNTTHAPPARAATEPAERRTPSTGPPLRADTSPVPTAWWSHVHAGREISLSSGE